MQLCDGRWGYIIVFSLLLCMLKSSLRRTKNESKESKTTSNQNKNLCQNLVGTQSKATNSQNPLAPHIFYPNHRVIDYKRLPHSSGWLYPTWFIIFIRFWENGSSGWFLSAASEVKYCSQELTVAIWLQLLKVMLIPLSFWGCNFWTCLYWISDAWLSFYRWHQYQVAYKSFPKPWLPY